MPNITWIKKDGKWVSNEMKDLAKLDLNSITVPGRYSQSTNDNTSFALNYPTLRAGFLEYIVHNTEFHYQLYWAHNTDDIYVRTKYDWTQKGWSKWVLISGEVLIHENVNIDKEGTFLKIQEPLTNFRSLKIMMNSVPVICHGMREGTVFGSSITQESDGTYYVMQIRAIVDFTDNTIHIQKFSEKTIASDNIIRNNPAKPVIRNVYGLP